MKTFRAYLEDSEKYLPWGMPGDVDAGELERRRDVEGVDRLMAQIEDLSSRQQQILRDRLQAIFARQQHEVYDLSQPLVPKTVHDAEFQIRELAENMLKMAGQNGAVLKAYRLLKEAAAALYGDGKPTT